MRYPLVWGVGVGNIVHGTRSLSVLYLFSYVAENTISQLLYVLGGTHPLKWVGHPLKCAVHRWKYLLYALGVGPV